MSDTEIKTYLRRQYYKNLHDQVNFNARGERRKNKLRPELAGLKTGSMEYRAAHTRLWRSEIKAGLDLRGSDVISAYCDGHQKRTRQIKPHDGIAPL